MPSSPLGPCVRIKWPSSFEFVPIHPQHVSPAPFETIEAVNNGRWLHYYPSVKRHEGDGRLIFEIKYAREAHPELKNHDVRWGITKVAIDRATKTVQATWRDVEGADFSGSVEAHLIEREKRSRTTARPVTRSQAQLRDLLLAIDESCSITGEKTATVLECAHVVAVEKGGFEEYGNAFLLRADLHRLFDAGGFAISVDGHVKATSGDLSKEYRDLLKDKRLNDVLTQRLRPALQVRATSA